MQKTRLKSLWKGLRFARRSTLPHAQFPARSPFGARLSHTSSRQSFTGHYIGFGAVGLGVLALVVSDDARQSTIDAFLVAERAGVVATATTRCFALYLRTLNANYSSPEEYQQKLSQTHRRAAEVTLAALRRNGGIYIKLGQHLSAMTYLLPFEWTETMVPLQSECPESSIEEIKEMFLKDTGVPLNEYFSEFDERPLGVASLAQVHTATLRDTGERVAVKLQHPSLDKFVPLDVELTGLVFDLIYRVFPQYPLQWLADELRESIYVELDFRNEANNAQRTTELFRTHLRETALRVPRVHSAQRRVLVMEFVGGARLDDLEYLDQHHISRSEVSSCLAHLFNNMIFQSGFVHCDPHHGNLAIRALDKPLNGHNFEVVLYDHGLYRTIPEKMKLDYAKFWLALIDKQPEEMRKFGLRFSQLQDEKLYPVLAAALTGRDFDHALQGDVAIPRTQDEIENMKHSLMNNGVILDLMSLLASLPRIVLLILKTNDLTRHLDESLQNPLGLERTFFIMATYCAGAVYKDEWGRAKEMGWWRRVIGELRAWWGYYRRRLELGVYDVLMQVTSK